MMSFHYEADETEVMSEINMTPLVDVMLVLLIIFIVAMPLITQAIKVQLPREQQQTVQKEAEAVTITLTRDISLHWNNEPVSRESMKLKLQKLAQQPGQVQVYLRADRQIAYEHVITLMADIRRQGVVNLGFVTQAK